ncbi:MAG: hypothetical protein K2I79_01695 [Clostridia bacterium]|nr:hypothetical protein [Clostridia bacterium]
MRYRKTWQIATAFILGIGLIIGPILLVVISKSLGKLNPTYYIYLILIALGAFSLVRGAMFLWHNSRLSALRAKGERLSASYVSHGTERQEGKVPMYYVRYTFAADGKTFNIKSPAIYSWEQALAFRAAQNFDILYYKGDNCIALSGAVMYSNYFDKVQQLKKAYNDAFFAVYDTSAKSEISDSDNNS